MKKLIFAAMMLLFATTAHAQKDVTKFLGIPVDGTKAEIIQKLKAKGFKSTYSDPEVLAGEFNGEKVNIHIVTNNNRVYRIMVIDQTGRDEEQIIIRFNTLCRQFEKNSKYTRILDSQTIPDTENIHNGIKVRNIKKYEAAYYPKTIMDSTMRANALLELMQIYDDTVTNYTVERVATLMGEEFIQKLLAINSKKVVWFRIDEYFGKYKIVMYYDNNYNRANGEDL